MVFMYKIESKIVRDTNIFLGLVATLISIGLIFIYSSSSVFALENFGSSHYYLKKQLIGLSLGIIAFFIARTIPLKFIFSKVGFIFLSSWFLTALTLIPRLGIKIYGSSRWLKIGPLIFQPSELLKIAVILYVAHFLAKKEVQVITFTGSYLPFLIIIGFIGGVLLMQPDFGMTVTLICASFLLLFIADFPLKYLLYTGAALIPALIFLIVKYPYRLKRILIFLDPWSDPQGAGFQIIQSLIAIGSGSWFGTGIGHSKQKFFYLPMQHTDFIFSIIAEEIGFIGSLCIIFLYIFFLYLGCKIAWQLKKPLYTYTTLGFTLLLTLQALTNFSVVTGLLPTKGIGLPFISFGSSSLISSLIMIGIISNLAHNHEYSS